MPDKLLFFMRRAPGLERSEFTRRYLESHAPNTVAHFPGLRRYVVNPVDDGWQPRVEHELAATDIVTEMWYDGLADFTDRARRYDSADGAVLVEREAAAIFGGGFAYHVRPGVQRDYERSWPNGEASPGVKMVYPVIRKQGVSREQFEEHWLHTHVPLVLKVMRGIDRYVTNVVVAPLGKAPEIDGIVELHFFDPEVLRGPRYETPESEALMAQDVAQFLTPFGLSLRTTEHIIRS